MDANVKHKLDDIILSKAQKFILSKLMLPNITPVRAYEDIMYDENLNTNTEILEKLGLIDIQGKELSISDAGIDAMKDAQLVDEYGELTEYGNTFAYANNYQDVEDIEKRAETSDNFESFIDLDLIKSINDDANGISFLVNKSVR